MAPAWRDRPRTPPRPEAMDALSQLPERALPGGRRAASLGERRDPADTSGRAERPSGRPPRRLAPAAPIGADGWELRRRRSVGAPIVVTGANWRGADGARTRGGAPGRSRPDVEQAIDLLEGLAAHRHGEVRSRGTPRRSSPAAGRPGCRPSAGAGAGPPPACRRAAPPGAARERREGGGDAAAHLLLPVLPRHAIPPAAPADLSRGRPVWAAATEEAARPPEGRARRRQAAVRSSASFGRRAAALARDPVAGQVAPGPVDHVANPGLAAMRRHDAALPVIGRPAPAAEARHHARLDRVGRPHRVIRRRHLVPSCGARAALAAHLSRLRPCRR